MDTVMRTSRASRALRVWTGWLAQLSAVVVVCALARVHALRARAEAGSMTAEYAIVALAAVAFAGLLLAIFRGGEVRDMLLGIVRRALTA